VETDYLVLGSGLAGLYFALRASEHGRVLVVSKHSLTDANSHEAQGGVAAVLGAGDTPEKHIEDTLRVGDGLCNLDVVDMCVRQGPQHILHLANQLG